MTIDDRTPSTSATRDPRRSVAPEDEKKLYGAFLDGVTAIRQLHQGIAREFKRPLLRYLTMPRDAGRTTTSEIRSAADARRELPRLTEGRGYFPSPASWEDEVLYFLMLDRFSDGKETEFFDNGGCLVKGPGTPLYRPGHEVKAPVGNKDGWIGGTLRGAADKLGYLQRLGVTAIWVSPIFRQVNGSSSYHGYGIQNFLDIDPHFAPGATAEERRSVLRDFVEQAHALNIRVILDIVLNHTGDVFKYAAGRHCWRERGICDWLWDGREHDTIGLYSNDRQTTFPFGEVPPDQWPDGAVWPRELQERAAFTFKGRIDNWDYDPEYVDGDFYSLKNVAMGHGSPGDFVASDALKSLADVYRFWIAYADIDGFRIDTVKHIEIGAARYFASAIHEFASCLGKESFYLIGEVTGGRRRAFDTLEQTGIDAALGIDEIPSRLSQMMQGTCDPVEYFGLFRNSQLLHKESQLWFNSRVVTMYDDHDMVGREKARLCHHYPGKEARARMALLALSLNTTTMGIPCIYYGSEQCFDGSGGDHDLRQAMFGGGFGPFGVTDAHFFDERSFVYTKLQELLRLREGAIALRRGRQYLRETSGNGVDFGLPTGFGGVLRGVIAWSRIFDEEEFLLALNTDLNHSHEVSVVVDASISGTGRPFVCEYDNLVEPIERLADDKKSRISPTRHPSGRWCLQLKLEPGQFMVWAKSGVVKRSVAALRNTNIDLQRTAPTASVERPNPQLSVGGVKL